MFSLWAKKGGGFGGGGEGSGLRGLGGLGDGAVGGGDEDEDGDDGEDGDGLQTGWLCVSDESFLAEFDPAGHERLSRASLGLKASGGGRRRMGGVWL